MSAEPSTRAAKPQGNSKCWEILESENMKNQQGQRPKTQALILCWKRWLGRMRKNERFMMVHGYVGGLVTNNVHGWDWASGNELILHSSKFHGCNTRWPFLSSCDALPTWRWTKVRHLLASYANNRLLALITLQVGGFVCFLDFSSS